MSWEPSGERRVSRRWVLKATGLAAGAAGLGTIGCIGGSGDDDPTTTPGEETPTNGASSPTPGNSTPTTSPGRHGETLRYTGFVERDNSWDPHKTQAGPFYGQQALVFSRLLSYVDQAEGVIQADLAADMPEMPDGQTITFRLNPAARWHDLPPLNGREVTADDVKHSVERQIAGDPTFVRRPQWSVVDTIEVVDARTITFKLKTPLAAMQHLFADTNSFIVAPELSADTGEIGPNHQVGSGPFQWVEWNDRRFASARRNSDWFGGGQRPYLDGLSLVQPANTGDVEAAIRTKQIDVATVGRPLADRLKRALPELVESTMGHSLFFGMRYSLRNHPYDDLRFRNAVTYAIDKRVMINKFFDGSGGVNPWISWPVSRWTLPESELTQYAGYRPGDGGRQEDLREAKAFFEAFLAEKQLPQYDNGLPLFVLDSSEYSIKLGSEIRDQLWANLGLAIEVYPMPLSQLVNLLLTAEAPFAAGPDTGWIDLDDWVYPYFHSNGSKNSFPLRDSELDALIEAQRVEFDEAARRELGYQIQRRLLAINAGVNLVSERVVTLSWPYVKGLPLDTADGYQHRLANTWIDKSDPTFQGR